MAANIWCLVIALCLTMYVVLDGYDLGIGILLPFERDPEDRRELIEIVATAWDGNESWIILLGVSLWGGLPVAYGAILPAIYLPLIVMLLAIIFRGVAIELVSSSVGAPRGWTWAFVIGSLIAAIAQGFAIGGVLSGVRLSDKAFAGDTFDFVTPLSICTAIATVLLYAIAGAAYIVRKSEDSLEAHARRIGPILLGIAVPLFAITAFLTGRAHGVIRLDSPGRSIAFWALVVVAVIGAGLAAQGFASGADLRPFNGVVLAEVAGLVALVVAMAPIVLPPSLTIADSAAPSGSLTFLLIGVGSNIPLILFYCWFAHHVFRGKYRIAPDVRPVGMSVAAAAIEPLDTTDAS